MKKTAFIISVIVACLTLSKLTVFERQKKFNQEVWNEDISKRKYMADDLIDSGILIGNNRVEITDILGNNYKMDSSNNITYFIAEGIDPVCIVILFNDNDISYKCVYATP